MSVINSHTALALAEGFGLAFSPCILPILPFILAASTVGNRYRPFLIIAGFVISFSIFALLSRKILASLGIQQDVLQIAAYGLLLLLGLTMLIPYLEARFATLTNRLASRAENFSSGKRAEGNLGALLVGALIGVVWTPCAGPILAAALLQIIQEQNNIAAFTTMLAFSLGAGVPMLLIALFGRQISHKVRAFSRHATLIRRGMGVVIVLFALFGLLGINVGTLLATSLPASAAVQPIPVADIETPTNLPSAPEVGGIKQWFNSNPLTIAQLKGKVVLIDFWTYSCINCIRTLPYIESWYEKYKDQGLVVIGVHTPEFPFEGEPDNVAAAIKKFAITYPVAMDNDFVTWKNFQNQYWPAHFLINRQGQVVEHHYGEGHYAETENAIRSLLSLTKISAEMPDAIVNSEDQTPETYVGYERAKTFSSPGSVATDEKKTYKFPASLEKNHWALAGAWTVASDHITAEKAQARLRLHFHAGKVYLVLGHRGVQPVKATLTLNGAPIAGMSGSDTTNGMVTIDQHRLYELVHLPSAQDGILEITANGAGLEAYAFTFGK